MGKNQKTDTLEKKRNEQVGLFKTFHTSGAAEFFVIEQEQIVK